MAKPSKKPVGRHSWPVTELRALFGDGEDYDATGWQDWLRKNRPEAAEALDRLVAAGVDRDTVVEMLMRLHAGMRWRPVTKEEVRDTMEEAHRFRRKVERMKNSDLREFLGLAANGPLPDLGFDITHFAGQLSKAAGWKFANRRESFARNFWLAQLLRYCKWATGTFQDDHLGFILTLLMGSHRNHPGELDRWRRDHAFFMKYWLWEDGWDARVKGGELAAPQIQPRRRPRRVERDRR